MMVRWICGVGLSLKNRISSDKLYRRLGVENVADVVRRGQLRWFGHLERKGSDDWVPSCRKLQVSSSTRMGRGRKTWDECQAGHALMWSEGRVGKG